MKVHELKILPQYFNEISGGHKKFELRKDDRGFALGDEVCLQMYDPSRDGEGKVIGYLGPVIRAQIDYVLRDVPQFGLKKGYAILGLCKIRIEDRRFGK